MRFRFLIADLMFLVVPCAVAFYVYEDDPDNLAEVLVALDLALVCLATLGSKFRRGNKKMKMFWRGFALFGWFYFVLGLQLGLNVDKTTEIKAIIGLTFMLVCGYSSSRFVRSDPCPGLRAREEAAPTAVPAPDARPVLGGE